MAYLHSIDCNTIRSEGEKADKPLSLKERIDHAHLFQALENSLEHGRETPHGVTGLTFKDYTITVHRRKNFSWLIKVKFKVDADLSIQPTPSTSRCGRRLRSS
jgi:hypothetical protein